ncbi:hypothetical protein DM826_09125 [Halonotius aquaticus]|uniref:Uncharacterized protein n=1 Tax=Halonotius aquaticus TaxID=2216978 RepID=A0A3A6PTK3_9EURY|nr:hypothetical protein [Halonotius aquaticus]RJX42839.1 hypothetical protein DM826_09125 [Halonotius aquaticus]
MDERLEAFLREHLRAAGRNVERTRAAFDEGVAEADDDVTAALPTDDAGRAQLVCRRHAVKRAATIDSEGRPACFDADHIDCRGCVEDIEAGRIETWEADGNQNTDS